ncbi:MAG: tetratricopeptide repeat protein [Mariprofundaceae bacterium]
MLTASASTPNMQDGENARPAPTPENWHGVTEGLNIARGFLSNGLYQEAVNTLKEILEFAPSEPQAWALLGDILEQHGHSNKAEACHKKAASFEKQTTVNPNSAPASGRLAQLLWSQGETDAAHSMLAVLLLRNPDSKNLLAMRQSWENTSWESTSQEGTV